MKTISEYIKGSRLEVKSRNCDKCNVEYEVLHISNWHDGTGILYCQCPKCKQEINARWTTKSN